jgi:hypothetical protein
MINQSEVLNPEFGRSRTMQPKKSSYELEEKVDVDHKFRELE